MCFKLCRLFLFFLLFVSVERVGASVYISELMADNEDTLLDEDGDASDWIELYNESVSAVDLTGWYLSDDETNLTKWVFPSVELDAGAYLVVFASGKDRAVPDGELHANFKLSAEGEVVCLTAPDGVSVEDLQVFPALEEDVSFGYASTVAEENQVVLDAGAVCSAHVPTSAEDSVGWRELGFDDSAWLWGTTGVGYENDFGYASYIGLDVSAMYGENASVYIRVPFEVEQPLLVNALTLKMKYDDGFVAYLNGTEVAAENYSGTPAWKSSGSNHSDSLAVVYESFDLRAYAGLLQAGENVLAIHGLNQSETSSDLLFVPRVEVGYAGGLDHSASGMLFTPTPGAVNQGLAYEGVVETPLAFPERGFFEEPFMVTLSNRTVGASIRYTLDGSEPTEESTLYTAPFTVSGTTPLRVKAFVEGWKPSFSGTHSYLFLDDVLAESRKQVTINNNPIITGLDAGVLAKTYYDAEGVACSVREALLAIPTLSVVTDEDNLFDVSAGIYVNPAQRWECAASVELINSCGELEEFQSNAGLRIRGGWSRHNGYAKHAFRLFFREAYGAGKLKEALFGEEGVDSFDCVDLRTAMNYNWTLPVDGQMLNTFLRDVFSRDAAGAMDDAYTRSRYYHLYLNGKYWGLYMTEERPEASYAASYFGGDADDYDVIKSTSWLDSPSYVAEATDGTLDAYYRLHAAAMAGFADDEDYFAVQGMDADGRRNAAKERLLDVDNLIDYLLLIYYAGASDNGITQFLSHRLNNLYAIYNRENPDGFKWIQHDCEHSLDTSTQLDRTGPFTDSHLVEAQYFNAQTLHEKLLENEEYRLRFADRAYKFFSEGGVLTQPQSEARFDARKAEIDRAIIANAARWGSTDLDRDTWVSAVETARAFFNNRETTVMGYIRSDGNLPSIAPPQISRTGGLIEAGTEVTLSADVGTIYYTLDGSDPRAIGGEIVGNAYTGALTFRQPTKVCARALRDGEWSALCEAVFWTEESPLAITELMYHAPSNQLDFIEVRNVSDATVNLQGYKLDRAIDFDFDAALAPGEFILAIKDVDGFGAFYNTNGMRIAGEYKGDFDNSGEKVELEFWNHDLISFRYSDARNWPQAADGAGHSLVPLDSAMDDEPAGSLNYGGNWRASTSTGGSPGYDDGLPLSTVVLNEITAHTDTGEDPPFESNDQIELYNPTASAVTLNGWALSDDLGELQKWVIPDGTVIPAFGFVLFDEDDFHPDRVSGFGLDKAGEEVVLSSPAGVVDAIRFKGQENGASLGRYPDGAVDWITTTPTPEASNEPFEESVWISALMYNPPAGDVFEYVQLENRSGAAITLETIAGSWRIDGGVSYTFPSGFSLSAGTKCWLVPFDPSNTAQLALFCTTYGLNASEETILGPYSGQLSNEGERVALEKPQDSDDPLKPDDISWIVVDELFYFDQSPWSAEADGTGHALTRNGLTEWGVPTDSDTDGDGLDDEWETSYFGSLLQSGNGDPDGDGFSNLQERIAGTNPANPASFFAIEGISAPTIEWNASEGRTYSVYWTADLQQPFTQIANGLSVGSYTDSTHSTNECSYYFIAVEEE